MMGILQAIGSIIVLFLLGWFVFESNKIIEDRDKQREEEEDGHK